MDVKSGRSKHTWAVRDGSSVDQFHPPPQKVLFTLYPLRSPKWVPEHVDTLMLGSNEEVFIVKHEVPPTCECFVVLRPLRVLIGDAA
jgi:hypothetical protein